MKTRVLDSWAILEWLNGRTRPGNEVAALLAGAEAGQARLLISAINVGEVYYFLRKQINKTLSESWRQSSRTLPVTIEVPTMDDIWAAALLKGDHPVSYPDAFAAALAKKHNCPMVTGDPEIRPIKHVELDWIGPRM